MADPKSYQEILEEVQELESLLDSPDIDQDEKTELAQMWHDLKSREAYKFDAIISVIKECDNCINQFTKELDELRENVSYWKSKRNSIINIIKLAYQQNLISSKPTGVKYQATIKPVLPKVIDNFNDWTDRDKQRFGLKKTVTVECSRDGHVYKRKEDTYADKEELRQTLMENPEAAPDSARLVRRVSMAYGLRKRLQKGV
jgi:hypothetical protein